MNDEPSGRDSQEPLFGFVRRLVLVAGAIVVAAWVVAITLWAAFRLVDW